MARVIVKHALRKHKEFIINASKKVNEINHIKQTNNLEENIERDYYGYAPKFECLIAEVDNEPAGMIIYSKYYSANEGESIWISQIYIDRKYRKFGVFIKLVKKLREENKDVKLISCGVKKGNKKTRKILSYYKAEEPDFDYYYINLNKKMTKKNINNEKNKNLDNDVKKDNSNNKIIYNDFKNKIAN